LTDLGEGPSQSQNGHKYRTEVSSALMVLSNLIQ